MKKPLRSLSAFLLISALAGLATLLVFDALNHLRLTPFHQRTGALSFMLIGASYISLQLSTGRGWREMIKGVLLGIGFFLWSLRGTKPRETKSFTRPFSPFSQESSRHNFEIVVRHQRLGNLGLKMPFVRKRVGSETGRFLILTHFRTQESLHHCRSKKSRSNATGLMHRASSVFGLFTRFE